MNDPFLQEGLDRARHITVSADDLTAVIDFQLLSEGTAPRRHKAVEQS